MHGVCLIKPKFHSRFAEISAAISNTTILKHSFASVSSRISLMFIPDLNGHFTNGESVCS